MSIVTYNNRSIANISAVPGAAKALTHIKTLTASSSSTLSFEDGSSDVVLDSTYPIYKFVWINCHASQDNTKLQFQGNASGGSGYNETITSTSFYARHNEGDDDTDFGYNGTNDLAQGTGYQTLFAATGTDNDQSASGCMYLFNPSSTTFVKHFLAQNSTYSHNEFNYNEFTAGYFNTTSAIDEIQFKMSGGNIDAGTFKLYGLKDS